MSEFGPYGGQWIPETLMPSVQAVAAAYEEAMADPAFHESLAEYHRHLGGRPTALYRCDRLTEKVGGATLWLKREDLVHGGAHKFNNVMGQALLARRMGKTQIIAETGAGQHGVATAMAGASLGIPVTIFMGAKDMERQALNVFRMQLFGARIERVEGGSATLKDAVNATLRAWAADPQAYYLVGSVVGPHPFPRMVRDFQKIIGQEIRQQAATQIGRDPDLLVACVGGGSNAIGTFYPFLGTDARLVGVEAGGDGVATGRHASAFAKDRRGILHGMLSYLFQEDGQVVEPHSISAGLDYPGVGPEHAQLHDEGRVEYVTVTDDEALEATRTLCELEGILPALESAHALAHAMKIAKELNPSKHIVVTLSGRGDKDVHTLQEAFSSRPS